MKLRFILPVLLLALLGFKLWTAKDGLPPIVNVHESVGGFEDIAKLQNSMGDLGMANLVLHGIPEDLLKFKEGKEIDLNNVGQNHDFLLEASAENPKTFDFFCTIDPGHYQALENLEACMEAGALGVKVYTGYTYTHTLPLNAPQYLPFYEAMEKSGAILSIPVNTGVYQDELEAVLADFPDLKTICSHYCLSARDLNRVANLLDSFPNLYIDTGYGHIDYVREGFTNMSENTSDFSNFFEDYQDRILFATNNVITDYEGKDEAWVENLYADYIAILTEAEFSSNLDKGVTYTGLELPMSIQRKVFWQNWDKLLDSI